MPYPPGLVPGVTVPSQLSGPIHPLTWEECLGRNTWEDPISMPEDMGQECINVMFRRGSLGNRRTGTAAVTVTSVNAGAYAALIRFVPGQDETVAELWIVNDAAAVQRVPVSTAVNVTLTDAIAGSPYAVMGATLNGKLYLAYKSAVNRLHVCNPAEAVSTVRRSGLPAASSAPTAANAGSSTYAAIQRWYVVIWQRIVNGVVTSQSNASPALSFIPSGSGASVTVTQPTPPGEGETHWLVGATIIGVNGPFFIASTTAIAIGTTTYSDSQDPLTYAAGTVTPLFGANYPFPSVKFLISDGSRLLGLGAYGPTSGAGPTTVSVDYLMAGGGASGGSPGSIHLGSGGGGAGQVVSGTDVLAAGAYTVTVGAGGAGVGSGSTGNVGGASSYNSHSAAGGLGGIGGDSGGGVGGASGSGQTGGNPFDNNDAGGGGGSTGNGHNAPSNTTGGAGGTGTSSSITGSAVVYGTGGGGAGNSTGGAGGPTGDGKGGIHGGANATAGAANTGDGGGGANNTANSGGGGSGVVIVRFITGQATSTGGSSTTSGPYTVVTFAASGTFTLTILSPAVLTVPPVDGRVYVTPVLGSTLPATGDDERFQITANQSDWINLNVNGGGIDRGLAGPVNDVVYAFQSAGIYSLIATGSSIVPYRRFVLSRTHGAVSQASIVIGEDESGLACLYFLSPIDGPRRIKAGNIMDWMGKDITDLWATVNQAASTVVAHGIYDQANKLVKWWVATGASNTPNLMIVYDTTLGVSDGISTRRGWAQWQGNGAATNCSALFSGALVAARPPGLVPYVGTASAIGRQDGTTNQDFGTNYQATIRSKAYSLSQLIRRQRLIECFLAAKAQAGTTIQLTVTKDAGTETQVATASIAPVGAETLVRPKVDEITLSDAFLFDFTLGDAAAVNAVWTLLGLETNAQVLADAR